MSEGLVEDQKGQDEVTLEDLKEQIVMLKSTNDRLLNEQKKTTEKYRRVRDENSELETFKREKDAIVKKQLEETENWKELLKMEQDEKDRILKERMEYSQKADKMAGLMVDKDLRFQVAKLAPDARDVEDLISQVKKGSLNLDEENLTFNGVQDAIDSVRENKPWYFESPKAAPMANSVPRVSNPHEKSFEEMTSADRDNLFKQALTDLEGQAS